MGNFDRSCICIFVFVYVHVRHPGTLFLGSLYQGLKNIGHAWSIVKNNNGREFVPGGHRGPILDIEKSEIWVKTKPYAKICKKIVLYMKILSFFAWHNFFSFSKWFSWANFLIALFSDKIKVISGRSLPGPIFPTKSLLSRIAALWGGEGMGRLKVCLNNVPKNCTVGGWLP